ncbi:radical SAM/SPASM domain-containing protein [Streptomyces sp. WAC00469]|uniref:radical SAM/SPASM domain-containing protein n=1 Tax=Streptomyces sp. WAC00469 TaxID=2487415 RepID=UPI000F737449|nr:radical SAM protein [Streptomyces sp. WAC00469]RSR95477.1 radical SAM protein [Streptomyces sp. WAC00469]
MQLSLGPATSVAATDELRFIERDGKTLVVAPGTAGWTVTDDAGTLGLLHRVNGARPLPLGEIERSVPRDCVMELFRRGLLSLDGIAYGTSSSRSESLQIVAPKSAHNTYPVLAVFHVHNWCNLACTYCYTIDDGVPPERLTREHMCKAVDDMVRLPTAFTGFEFHGGEPTMAMPDIEAVTRYAEEVYAKAGKRAAFSIQTNGYYLSEKICDFLAEHRFSVRVSLDGTEETHDEFRVDRGGKGSYRGVVSGIRLLQDRGVPVHAVCVVHIGNTDRIVEMYDSMAALGVQSIRFLPVFKTGKADEKDWLTGDRYFEAYLRVVKHVAARGRRGEPVVPLANLIAGELGSLRSFRREYMCMRNPCGAGVNMITVDVNGDLYPCEEMVGKPEFVIGNLADTSVREAIDTSPVVQKLRERHVEEIPECSRCTWKQLCHGGCVHKSYTHFKRLDRESEHCSYYKRIYEELIWLEQAEPGSWDALSPAGR